MFLLPHPPIKFTTGDICSSCFFCVVQSCVHITLFQFIRKTQLLQSNTIHSCAIKLTFTKVIVNIYFFKLLNCILPNLIDINGVEKKPTNTCQFTSTTNYSV